MNSPPEHLSGSPDENQLFNVGQPRDAGEFGHTVMSNVFELWFTPEMERRKAEGLIGDDFVLMFAQAIFPEDGPNQIRLNYEVRGVMTVEARRPATLGEQALISDLEGVRGFELIDEELDCGHITVVRRGATDSWMISFNALAGRRKAAGLVSLAGGFLATSKIATERGYVGPAIDNLFSACELLAKAELIMHRSKAVRSKKHRAIGSAINLWAQLGNVHPVFVRTMNRAANLRSAARYDATVRPEHLPTAEEFEAVGAYLAYLGRLSSASLAGVLAGSPA